MSYLRDQINETLIERIQIQCDGLKRCLVLDFESSTLRTYVQSNAAETNCFSLLETMGGFEQNLWRDMQFDVVIINLQIAWLDHTEIFPQLRSVLAPGGKLFFSSLGPDTLIELHQAWEQIDTMPHVHGFVDMHHLGDQLVRCGFSKPIVDTDWLGVEYDDVDLLMSDLRTEGAHNVLSTRRKTLLGKGKVNLLRQIFAQKPGVQITFELIFGYAEVSETEGQGIKVQGPVPISNKG